MTKYFILIILILGLVIGLYLISQKTSLFSKAGVSDIPKEVKISNIADNSFTISWITDIATPGFIQYGKDQNLGQTALDDRDSGSQTAHFTHHVSLKNLDPNSPYYFKIGSGAKVYDNSGQPYTQTTAPTTTDTPPLADPLFGKVLKQNGQAPNEALVYLQPEHGTVLSSYIRSDGNFLITLTNARADNLSSYLTFDSNRKMTLVARAGLDGVVQQDVNPNNRTAAQQLVLQQSAAQNASWPADLNGDGVINAFDFALYVKSKLIR